MIKAIETRYGGHRFRSRLEARWAVFLTEAGIPWEYEPEGFQLKAGWYLPDFRVSLPDNETLWLEIKGVKPGNVQDPRHTEFARECPGDFFVVAFGEFRAHNVFSGMDHSPEYMYQMPAMRSGEDTRPWGVKARWGMCDGEDCGTFTLRTGGKGGRGGDAAFWVSHWPIHKDGWCLREVWVCPHKGTPWSTRVGCGTKVLPAETCPAREKSWRMGEISNDFPFHPHSRQESALIAARSARFEFGEKG